MVDERDLLGRLAWWSLSLAAHDFEISDELASVQLCVLEEDLEGGLLRQKIIQENIETGNKIDDSLSC